MEDPFAGAIDSDDDVVLDDDVLQDIWQPVEAPAPAPAAARRAAKTPEESARESEGAAPRDQRAGAQQAAPDAAQAGRPLADRLESGAEVLAHVLLRRRN